VPRKAKYNAAAKNGAATLTANAKPKKQRARTKKSVRKKPLAPAGRTKTLRQASPAASAAEPSDEMIRTRAYFIAERRHNLGLPGDAGGDWLEAKRQLLSELGPR